MIDSELEPSQQIQQAQLASYYQKGHWDVSWSSQLGLLQWHMLGLDRLLAPMGRMDHLDEVCPQNPIKNIGHNSQSVN